MKLHSFLVLFIMAAMPAVFAGIGIRHDIAYNGRPGEGRLGICLMYIIRKIRRFRKMSWYLSMEVPGTAERKIPTGGWERIWPVRMWSQ